MTRVITKEHDQRIKQELLQAGLPRLGLLRMESRYLPRVIDHDEVVEAVIYGRMPGVGGAMLVATDKRVIFLDKKPLFVTLDELSYKVVAGVKVINEGIYAQLTLHTRMGDYIIGMLKHVAADKFAKYVEQKSLNLPMSTGKHTANNHITPTPAPIKGPASEFIKHHEVAVLSTIDRGGSVHGAAVYCLLYSPTSIYVATKTKTNKAQNLLSHGQIALTGYDQPKLQSLQIHGWAEAETDQILINDVFAKLVKPRDYNGEERLPPVSQIDAGDYTIIKITPTLVKFSDFKKS